MELDNETKNKALPENWHVVKIRDVMKRVRNSIEVKKDSVYREIGIKSHGKGIFYKDKVTGESLGNKSVFWVEPDCFIVNIVFAWELAVAKTTSNEEGMIASHRFPMYKPVKDKLDLDFITYLFKTPYGKYLLNLASPGGAGRNKTLGQEEFLELEIKIPKSILEQKRIASILSTWDKAISLKEDYIRLKKVQKKGLMQMLLTGKLRKPGSYGEWEEAELGDISECLDNMRVPLNSNQRDFMKGSIPYYGANGIVDYINQHIFEEELILLAEDGGYFDEFTERPIAIRINGKAWVNNHAHILRIIKSDFDFVFFSLVHKDIRTYINGTTRGKLTKGDMLGIKIHLPKSISEQREISNILNSIFYEIYLHEQQLELIKKQKKGLMQLLLTGKVRVEC